MSVIEMGLRHRDGGMRGLDQAAGLQQQRKAQYEANKTAKVQGVGNGIATGASLGMLAGPKGAVLGAAIGGLIGGFL